MISIVVAALFLLSSGASLVTSADEYHASSKDRLIISYSPSTAGRIESIAADAGAEVELIPQSNLAFLIGWDSALMNAIKKIPGVEGVERERRASMSFTPDDSYYSLYQWGVKRINADEAWDYTKGSHNVTVAVLDTGIDYTHDDLTANMWKDPSNHYGYDFWNDDTDPMDDNINGYDAGVWTPNVNIFHGTHVAGVVGSVIDNAIGIAGVAQCKLMAVKVMNDSGEGTDGTVAQGIIWATDQGADIITMSLGVDSQTIALTNAVLYASNHGVLMVAAAGNEGNPSVSYPAAYPQVIAVGASDKTDHRASFSNYGSAMELMAPGVQIWSARQGDLYQELSGTSTAAPSVTGVAALMLSVDPALTPVEIRTYLNQTADDLGLSGWDTTTGWGIVDARAAVSAVSGSAVTIVDYPASATPNASITIEWVVSGSGSLPINQTYLRWGYSLTQMTHTSAVSYGNTTPHTFSASGIIAPNAENASLFLQAVAVINGTQYLSPIVEIPVQSNVSDPFQNLIKAIRDFIMDDLGLLNFIILIFAIVAIAIVIAVYRRSARRSRIEAHYESTATVSSPPPEPMSPQAYLPPPPAPPQEALSVFVDISNGAIAPASMEIFEGTRVIWRNRDWAPPPGISIVSGVADSSGPHPDGLFASGMMVSPGEYWSCIFNAAGVYPYYVSNLQMNGRVIVRARN